MDDVSFVEDVEPEPIPPVGAKLPETEALSLAWLSPITKATPTGAPPGLKEGDGAVYLDGRPVDPLHPSFHVAYYTKSRPTWGMRQANKISRCVQKLTWIPELNLKFDNLFARVGIS